MARVFYIECIRMIVIVTNLAFLGIISSAHYDYYLNLSSNDETFMNRMLMLIMTAIYSLMVIFTGLWGALVNNVTLIQTCMGIIIIGHLVLILLHFTNYYIWIIDSKELLFLGLIEVLLLVMYYILIANSKTELHV